MHIGMDLRIREEQLGGITVLDKDGSGTVTTSNAIIEDLTGPPVNLLDATNKEYVDTLTDTLLPLDGSRSMTSSLDMDGNKIINLANPDVGTDAVNLDSLELVADGLLPLDGSRHMLGTLNMWDYRM